MKKIYTTFAFCALAASAVTAQQLPNAGFEDVWVDCTPWTFYQGEDNFGTQSTFKIGLTPTGWNISNVSGMAGVDEDGTPSGFGATAVGSAVEGYNSDNAVQLVNTPNPFMDAQIVPAYLTLGTPWSTANPTFDMSAGFQIVIKNSDGGTFGGVPFTGRPTGIEFMYKRSRGADKPAEKSTVVAYLWKGHWTQKDVPSTIYMTGEPYKTDMVDRDRCVLGMDMTGSQGGEVSKTDDAELIAVINAEITEDASEWTKFSATFDYKSDATPEMLNIVIAAGDYFGGADVVGKDNTLIVDDVKLLYDEKPQAKEYAGKLTIFMNGGYLTSEGGQDATIEITTTSENTCDFVLPNFSLDLGAGPTPLGDIVVNDVKTTTVDGVTTYEGAVNGLQLLGGAIVADVTLNGTTDDAGNVDMKIDVLWNDIPINVTFTKTTTGVAGIVADSNAAVEYYNLSGVRVSGDTPGLYIRRQGNTVTKVLVR